MCVFLQNQNFQRHTEQMMGLMAEGGKQAAARLIHVNASLTQQACTEPHYLKEVRGTAVIIGLILYWFIEP